MLVGRNIFGNFEEAILGLRGEDGVSSEVSVTQDDTTGLLTIGYGYSLIVETKKQGKTTYTINPELGSDLTGIHKFSAAEATLLKTICSDLDKGDVSGALSAFDGRASNVLSFTITAGSQTDQAEKLFQKVLNRDVSAAHLLAIADNASMKNTYELALLEDLAVQNPALVTAGLRSAVSAGQRQQAWYDIVTLNSAKDSTVEEDRIIQAAEFGLYSEGSSPKNAAEAISVYRFLDAKETSLEHFLVATGETSDDVTSNLLQWYDGAYSELLDTYGAFGVEEDVMVAPNNKGDTIVFGKGGPFAFFPDAGSGDGALIVGGTGNDKLIISGNLADTLGEGNTIFYAAGGGTDTVNSLDLTAIETLAIASGPGTVNVEMGRFETLKLEAPTTFKGVVSNFLTSNAIDLAGVSATDATLGKNDILKITESDGHSFSLHLGGSIDYDDYIFETASDASGGTEIRLLPKGWSLITFSEYPEDTTITNQYRKDGVVFTSKCFIIPDSADPTSLALSGTPKFEGAIKAKFVDPTTGKQGAVKEFSFDAGYFDSAHSTRVSWYNLAGKLIGTETDPHLGYEHFDIKSNVGIGSFTVGIVGKEAAGFSFDNLAIGRVIS